MTPLETAWQEFSDAIAEARARSASGASAEVLRDVPERARELLTILDREMAASGLTMSGDDKTALEQLRAWLVDLATPLIITKH